MLINISVTDSFVTAHNVHLTKLVFIVSFWIDKPKASARPKN